MKQNFIHLPFNMLFYLILKNPKHSVLYGLNKGHVNFIAHPETESSLVRGRLAPHSLAAVRAGPAARASAVGRKQASRSGHCAAAFPGHSLSKISTSFLGRAGAPFYGHLLFFEGTNVTQDTIYRKLLNVSSNYEFFLEIHKERLKPWK